MSASSQLPAKPNLKTDILYHYYSIDVDDLLANETYYDPDNKEVEPQRTLNANILLTLFLKEQAKTKLLKIGNGTSCQSPEHDLTNIRPRCYKDDKEKVWQYRSSSYAMIDWIASEVSQTTDQKNLYDETTLANVFHSLEDSSIYITKHIKREAVAAYAKKQTESMIAWEEKNPKPKEVKEIKDWEKLKAKEADSISSMTSQFISDHKTEFNQFPTPFDSDKLLITYYQMHVYAGQHPANAAYTLIDDSKVILNNLKEFYDHSILNVFRPACLVSSLRQYDGKFQPEIVYASTLSAKLGGEIDDDPASSIKEMVKIYGEIIYDKKHDENTEAKKLRDTFNPNDLSNQIMKPISGLKKLGELDNFAKTFLTYRANRSKKKTEVLIEEKKSAPSQILIEQKNIPAIDALAQYKIDRNRRSSKNYIWCFAFFTKMSRNLKFEAVDLLEELIKRDHKQSDKTDPIVFTDLHLKAFTDGELAKTLQKIPSKTLPAQFKTALKSYLNKTETFNDATLSSLNLRRK